MLDRKVNPFTFGPCSLKLIITNPGFNFNLGPYFFCQKVLSFLILTCFTWNTLYYNIVGENNLWELYITILRSDLNSNFLRTWVILTPIWANRPRRFGQKTLFEVSCLSFWSAKRKQNHTKHCLQVEHYAVFCLWCQIMAFYFREFRVFFLSKFISICCVL